MVERVRNRARIHLNLGTIVVFSGLFLYQALQGRKARASGVSVEKMNSEWHRLYNDPDNVERKIPGIRPEEEVAAREREKTEQMLNANTRKF